MADPFVGEIRMFAGNFAPSGWALCNGQLLAISSNDVLFSLIGTTYGGDGENTFGLPDLRGRIPLHPGTGPGLSPRPWGGKSGAEQVMLTVPQMPSHAHQASVSTAEADSRNPRNRLPARPVEPLYAPDSSPLANLNANAVATTGGGQSHNNLMPYQCVSFIIALFGIYPSRS